MTNQQQKTDTEKNKKEYGWEDGIADFYYDSDYKRLIAYIHTHFLPRSEAIAKDEIRGIVPNEKEWTAESETNQDFGWNVCRDEVITRLKKLGIEI